MSVANLPDPVRRFILTSVSSVPHLEAMLLMRSHPAEHWTATRLGQRLYIRDTDAAGLLEALAGTGLARRTEDGWRFTERVYEIRYRDQSPLPGSAPA